jgi:hypothetical protein
MLWTGRVVGRRKGESGPPLVEVLVDGREGNAAWSWGMELQHAGAELVFLSQPFLHPLGGNDLGEVKEHLFALRDAYPDLRGLAILDRTKSPAPADHKLQQLFYWRRREIENFLLVPAAIELYVA